MTVDLHLDTLWQMTKRGYFQVDLNAFRGGGLDSAVFALYLHPRKMHEAKRLIDEQIDFFRRQHWGSLRPYLAMENGALLRGDLTELERYAGIGIVYLTLTHNFANELGDSATDAPQSNGLTPLGVEVVHRCNELGVLVDVSHTSAATSHMAIGESNQPVIASHSGCVEVLAHPRNLSDPTIRAIARTGGLVGVPFVRKFVGTRSGLANHIDHIVQLVGVRHVAIGSDIDGADLVDGVGLSNWYDTVAEGLTKRGYNQDALDKVTGGNFERLVNRASTPADSYMKEGK